MKLVPLVNLYLHHELLFVALSKASSPAATVASIICSQQYIPLHNTCCLPWTLIMKNVYLLSFLLYLPRMCALSRSTDLGRCNADQQHLLHLGAWGDLLCAVPCHVKFVGSDMRELRATKCLLFGVAHLF